MEGGLAIVSALPSWRRGAGDIVALRTLRTAWLQHTIAKVPKRLEPTCDFRARHDQVGIDDVLPLQLPIVGFGELETGDTPITPGRVR
jgi:hypothetical protein